MKAVAALLAAALLAAVLAGCTLAAADHERLGDAAYGALRYDNAVAEYSAAEASGGRPRLWAKLGAAALHNKAVDEHRHPRQRLAVDALANAQPNHHRSANGRFSGLSIMRVILAAAGSKSHLHARFGARRTINVQAPVQ